jgi:outer membrane protein OmpA-like peptidoglycan-associated protein/tetratricopeptide (TPR) repeat protein
MMKKILITLIAITFSSVLFAQNSYFRARASREFNRLNYSEAITYYEHLLKDGGAEINDLKNLATAYLKVNDPKDAERILKMVIEQDPDEPLFVKKYALVLETNTKYKEAIEQWKKYVTLAPDDKMAQNHLDFLAGIDKAVKDSAFVDIYDLSINSHWTEFSPTLYDNDLVFISNRAVGPVHYVFEWNHTPFLDIYFADTAKFHKRIYKRNLLKDGESDNHKSYTDKIEALHDDHTAATSNDNDTKGYYGHHPVSDEMWDKDTVYGEVTKKFNKHLHSKYHEGSLAFTKDLKKMYFTANNPSSKKTDGIIKLMIMEADLTQKDKYKHDKKLPFVSNEYSVCHPTVTAKGDTMYFSSDMPGGFGGMDLYRVTKVNGKWGTPHNLGAKVNTTSHELFPHIDSKNILYFATEGWGGFGGLDVVKIDLQKETKPTNLGFPINSNKDDFGLIMKTDKSGYLSSNRRHGGIDDDVLFFFDKRREKKKLVVIAKLKKLDGTIVLLDSVHVKVKEKTTQKVVADTLTRLDRTNAIILPTKKVYEVVGEHPDVAPITAEVDFDADLVNDDTVTMVFLQEEDQLQISGVVVDAATNKPLSNVKVHVYDASKGTFTTHKTDANGKYSFPAKHKTQYITKAVHDGYFSDCQQINVVKPKGNKNTEPLKLSKIQVNKTFEIKDLYYDYNKDNIRADAAIVLDRLIAFLQEYPEIQVELGSHTDARGGDKYNHDLSQRRATSAVNYVVQNGIDRARITAKGYGETKLLNRCKNNVKCTDEEHQKNRRTEVRVTKVEKDPALAAKAEEEAEKHLFKDLKEFDPCRKVTIGGK